MQTTTPTKGMGAAFGGLVERYSGKKFGIFLIAMATVLLLVQTYFTMAGEQYEMAHVVEILKTAMIAIGIIGFGAAIAVGIQDHGKARATALADPVQNDPVNGQA